MNAKKRKLLRKLVKAFYPDKGANTFIPSSYERRGSTIVLQKCFRKSYQDAKKVYKRGGKNV